MFINARGWFSKNKNFVANTSPMWFYFIMLINPWLIYIAIALLGIQAMKIKFNIRK